MWSIKEEILMMNGTEPVTVFVATNDRNYVSWYAQEGAMSMNETYDTIEHLNDLNNISDSNTMSFTEPIESIEEFENIIELYL